jgi:4-alpha-glucanotransferase
MPRKIRALDIARSPADPVGRKCPVNVVTTDRWGIDDGYHDALGVWRPTTARTREAILAAMGGGADAAATDVRVVRRGERATLDAAGELVLEDGTRLAVRETLPPDLPSGYHELATADRRSTLLVTPGRCQPAPGDAWGWAVQLYAARSHESWGIGDFADLARLARWARSLGARVILANPFHPAVPATEEDPSPYSPSSRRYRNPLYLRIEDVPGASSLGVELEPLAAAGRALNRERRIDRDHVRRLKRDALERLWRRFGGDDAFDRYVRGEGRALTDYAVFVALAERHGTGWREWPSEYRRPDAPAVRRFADAHGERIRFHQWLQWLLDVQLARAAGEIALLHDFPIGVDRNGADAWAWQDVLATDAAVGAPPDRYARHGQNWGLPPFIPHRLRAARYAPFVDTLRGVLRHGGGLRIDHVMGLFRLFWIPGGLEPGDGAYVRYPAEELLAIVAIESERAGALIVGEDLGTVEPGVRERLAGAGILSYRVLWFENDPAARYPALALASVTTHDLPTIAGVWTGADLAGQRAIGLDPNPELFDALRARLAALTGVGAGGPVDDVIAGAYAELATAPSAIVTATLEDALGVEERPNMPGTFGTWPNWSLALPRPLEELERAELPLRIARVLNARQRQAQTGCSK